MSFTLYKMTQDNFFFYRERNVFTDFQECYGKIHDDVYTVPEWCWSEK
jgi:hypothetical protein